MGYCFPFFGVWLLVMGGSAIDMSDLEEGVGKIVCMGGDRSYVSLRMRIFFVSE